MMAFLLSWVPTLSHIPEWPLLGPLCPSPDVSPRGMVTVVPIPGSEQGGDCPLMQIPLFMICSGLVIWTQISSFPSAQKLIWFYLLHFS